MSRTAVPRTLLESSRRDPTRGKVWKCVSRFPRGDEIGTSCCVLGIHSAMGRVAFGEGWQNKTSDSSIPGLAVRGTEEGNMPGEC